MAHQTASKSREAQIQTEGTRKRAATMKRPRLEKETYVVKNSAIRCWHLWYFNIIIIHIKSKHGVIGRFIRTLLYTTQLYRLPFGRSFVSQYTVKSDELAAFSATNKVNNHIVSFFLSAERTASWSALHERAREGDISEKKTIKRVRNFFFSVCDTHAEITLSRAKFFFSSFVFSSSFNFYNQVEHILSHQKWKTNYFDRVAVRSRSQRRRRRRKKKQCCKKLCNSIKTGTWAVNAGALSRLLFFACLPLFFDFLRFMFCFRGCCRYCCCRSIRVIILTVVLLFAFATKPI